MVSFLGNIFHCHFAGNHVNYLLFPITEMLPAIKSDSSSLSDIFQLRLLFLFVKDLKRHNLYQSAVSHRFDQSTSAVLVVHTG